MEAWLEWVVVLAPLALLVQAATLRSTSNHTKRRTAITSFAVLAVGTIAVELAPLARGSGANIGAGIMMLWLGRSFVLLCLAFGIR